jgi:hypothetical protein
MATGGRRVYFREVQSFRRWWLWLVLLVPFVVIAASLARLVQRGAPASLIASLVGACLLLVLIALWLYVMRLETEVDDDALALDFRWFWRRREIPLAEIRGFEAVTYNPLRDYGGWGIRYGWRGGMAYNVSGRRGVQLELADGARLLVGSQRAEELARAIAEATRTQSQPREPVSWR